MKKIFLIKLFFLFINSQTFGQLPPPTFGDLQCEGEIKVSEQETISFDIMFSNFLKVSLIHAVRIIEVDKPIKKGKRVVAELETFKDAPYLRKMYRGTDSEYYYTVEKDEDPIDLTIQTDDKSGKIVAMLLFEDSGLMIFPCTQNKN